MRLNKKILCIIGGILLVGILITMVLLKKDETEPVQETYVTTTIVRESGNTWEIRVVFPAGKKFMYLNGEQKEVLQELGIKETKPHIELPEVEEGENIEETDSVQVITWKCDLKRSASYVKYLMDNGYTELRYAATQSYIEMYLQKEDKIKRLIISSENLMVADVLNKELPDIKYYYQ